MERSELVNVFVVSKISAFVHFFSDFSTLHKAAIELDTLLIAMQQLVDSLPPKTHRQRMERFVGRRNDFLSTGEDATSHGLLH